MDFMCSCKVKKIMNKQYYSTGVLFIKIKIVCKIESLNSSVKVV